MILFFRSTLKKHHAQLNLILTDCISSFLKDKRKETNQVGKAENIK